VPTDTSRGWTRARNFTLRAAAWSLGLFGLLRLDWVETHGVLPLTQLQGRLAVGLCGRPAFPIEATLACSGADALSLCLGVILAYPATWRMRLVGAGGGLGLILGLNTLRIGTLGRAAGSPTWFEALHVYLWPAALTLAIAGYVFGWMRVADRRRVVGAAPPLPTSPAETPGERLPARLTRRFVLLTAVLLLLFTAASPLYLESARVLVVAIFITRAAATALRLLGVETSAAANVLSTPRGAFMVTQECISTPLIPVYLAAVLAYSRTWRRGALGLLATAPLFVGLGIARLMVVALPAALVASPVFLVHAFYQLLLAGVVVFLAAFWGYGVGRTALHRALLAVLLGSAFVHLLGAPYGRLVTSVVEMLGGVVNSGLAASAPFEDPQRAIAALPAFQVGLYVALWVAALPAVAWRRFLCGLALLQLTQVAALLALHALASHSGLTPHVRDVRAWALVGPILVIAAVVNVDRLLGRPTRVAGPAEDGARG
jgi:exosortase/archaeosortase family protein